MSGMAWVTLATNDSYSLGALVLAHSLRQVNTAHQLVVIVTPGVTNAMREKLATVFDQVFEVNILDSKDEVNLRLLQRPELGVTFTKLHCWRLTNYKKCVFLDADTLVLQNCDELFEREELSAAPDVGWPDCFNSGVFVYSPSNDTYESLITFAIEHGSFDGGDQGLLNLYFSDWAHTDINKHLPFIYNLCSTACYSYLPAFKQFGEGMKIIHFIGPSKPWLQMFNSETLRVSCAPGFQHLEKVLQQWWDLFCAHVHLTLSHEMSGIAGALAQMTLGENKSSHQLALEDHLRRQCWEVGNIDYMGRDSFNNIWKKISETMTAVPVMAQEHAPTTNDTKTEVNIKSKSQENKKFVENPLTPMVIQATPPTSPPINIPPAVESSPILSVKTVTPETPPPPSTASSKQKSSVAIVPDVIKKTTADPDQKTEKLTTATEEKEPLEAALTSPIKTVPMVPAATKKSDASKLKETEKTAELSKIALKQVSSEPKPSVTEPKPITPETTAATTAPATQPTPPPRKGNKSTVPSTPVKKGSKKK